MPWLKIALLTSFVFLFHFPVETFADDARLKLTPDEKQWLKAHPKIRVAPDPDFEPFEWFTLDGSYKGMAADYLGRVKHQPVEHVPYP